LARGEEGRPFRLSYDAPPECPAKDRLVERIRASSVRARPGNADERAVELSVHVVQQAGGFVGVLTARRPDGTGFTRGVPAPDCEQSIAAIALIAAITIDPDAALEAAVVPPSEAPPASPPQAPPFIPPPPLPGQPDALDSRDQRRTPSRSKRPLGWSLGARAGATSAIAPEPIPDVGGVLAYEGDASGWFAPRASISALYAFSSTVDHTTGRARYDRLGGRAAVCPIESPDITVVSLRPCVGVELGRLHAQGVNVPNQTEQSLLWAAVGASLRADRMLAPWLTVGLEAGALITMIRNGFFFDPRGEVVHRVHDVAAQVAVEVGFQPF
jgi:hypothetical protein